MRVNDLKSLLNECENPALLFYKLMPWFFLERFTTDGEPKKKEVLEEFFRRLKYKNKDYKSECPALEPSVKFRVKTAYRLAIGMGYPSLVENGILLHHTYGLPYIPGETLKGLARHVFLLSLSEFLRGEKRLSSLEQDLMEDKEPKDMPPSFKVVFSEFEVKKPYQTFQKLFGTLNKRGEIIFYDAYVKNPNPEELFEMDIMNPHYAPYYQKDELPGDWHNPTPIHFLVVKEGVEFEVCLSYLPLNPTHIDESLLELAKELLRVGLENFGVGGKKRKGYGWFEVVE